MSNITSELNLSLAVDDDDTADYLTVSLANSLGTLDGLFNATTGHNHNGSHQGGELEFLDLIVGEDLTVVGSLTVQGPTQLAALTTSGLATLNSLDVTTTSRFRGAATFDAAIQSGGTLTIAQDLAVGRDLTVARNASVVGTLTVGTLGGSNVNISGSLTVGGAAVITGSLTTSGVLNAARVVTGGYDVGLGLNVAGNAQASGLFYQRGGTGRAWDNIDFLFGVPAAANTVVQRDPSGYIQASFINYAGSGVEGGKPTHVIGRNAGDTYLRWWPANALSPPVGMRVQTTAAVDFPDNGGETLTEVARLNVTWSGYYQVYMSGTLNQFAGNAYARFRIRVAGGAVDQGDGKSNNFTTRIGLVHRGFMAAGTLVQLDGTKNNQGFGGGANVTLVAVFIPESDYPN